MRSKLADALTGISSPELKLYSGDPPADVNDAATGDLLADITGLSWVAASNGTAALDGTFSDTNTSAGTFGYGRLVSGTYVLQGPVGVAATNAFVVNAATAGTSGTTTLASCHVVQLEADNYAETVKLNNELRSHLIDQIDANLDTLQIYGGFLPSVNEAPAVTLLVNIPNITWDNGNNGSAGLSGTFAGTSLDRGALIAGRLRSGSAGSLWIQGMAGTSASGDFIASPSSVNGAGEVISLLTCTAIQPEA